MHYSYAVTVDPTDLVSDPLVYDIRLGAGIITRLQIFFPEGTGLCTRCILVSEGKQLAPTNPDGYYSLDGGVIDASLWHNMDESSNLFYLVAWNVEGVYPHTLTVLIDVKGVDEPDLFSIMDRLRDTTDRLIDLMRSVF